VEQRRLLLAFALSLVLLILYQEFVLRRYRRPVIAPRTPPPEAPAGEAAAPAAEPTGERGLAAPGGEAAMVRVDTDLLRVIITSVGARLADLELKSFRRSVAGDSQPLDLVQGGPVLPLTLQLGAGASDAGLVYRSDRTELVLHGGERGEVAFESESPNGLHLEKRYAFTGDGYLFELTVKAMGASPPPPLGLVLTPLPPERPGSGGREVAVALANRRLIEKPVRDLLKQALSIEESTWGGFAAQYFLVAAVPEGGSARVVMTAAEGLPVVRLDTPPVAGGAAFALYAGPKDREVLARAGHELDRALDFGWFWFIAIPLLYALRALHRVTGNYGIAIIVLTALVKLATAPLTRTTFRNMREMQKIQPQMAKLRERYKDDQVALQKEMMELYRRHRVNPLSGCLPMVLQLPIFVGLYNTLLHAIELRHAFFALWINDLSAPDRLMVGGIGVPVLTLLMGASMLFQQWLTPQQGDPTQQRMMMFMPLVFTFMFINFPAGLVLYWLVNNVLSIGQQYLMMRATT